MQLVLLIILVSLVAISIIAIVTIRIRLKNKSKELSEKLSHISSYSDKSNYEQAKDRLSALNMGGKTKRAMLSERSEVRSRDVSVSYGAMS